MDVEPEIGLQIVMRFAGVELQGQHQLLHKLEQPPIARGARDDKVKARVALDLCSVISGVRRRRSRFSDDLLELREILVSQPRDA
jgi:hypothetical protein